MKKLTKKKIVLLLVFILPITYFVLRYYLAPGLLDPDHIYYKVYNYKVSKIKPQKKIIKDLNVEFIHDSDDMIRLDGDFQEEIRQHGDYYSRSTILHVIFTDNSKADIELEIAGNREIGPGFNNQVIEDALYQKLSRRFPNLNRPVTRDRSLSDSILLLYQGDTLYQISEAPTVISYRLENPKTKKLQTYYEYGSQPKSNWVPIYYTQSNKIDKELREEFFDDYNKKPNKNFWDRAYYGFSGELTIPRNYYYYKMFYSDDINNLPLGISATGSQFRMTITDTYLVEKTNDGHYKVKSATKTYTNENKEEYIKEILNKN